jgi:glycosyltransferase involved in cell wall biosynthesis
MLREGGAPEVVLRSLDGVPHDAVPTWLNAADAVLLTSAHEGSPNVVKEALACNVPVVSVDVGDVRERLTGIEGCSVVSPEPEDLAGALERALEHGRIDGRERVGSLSTASAAAKLCGIYGSVIDARRGAGPRAR